MLYAIVHEGQMVDRREADLEALPEYKRAALDVRGDGGPTWRPIVYEGEGADEEIIVEFDKVRIVRSPISIPPTTIADVKAEAQRRIFGRYPQWKQANMTARAVELLQIGQTNWSAEEQAEAAALNAAWAWIKAIRTKSDEIELLEPLPADITHDSWWS